jgi:hypothetical protein
MSQANCSAVKHKAKKANPTISNPVMDASLKGLSLILKITRLRRVRCVVRHRIVDC